MLQVQNLKKIYQMGSSHVFALNGINLHIRKNEFVAVMGASGSGKSTFMNILGCLDSPSEGSYTLNGQEVANLDDDRLAKIRNKHLGFVFQNFNLLPRMSAVRNVSLPLRYSTEIESSHQEKAETMLRKVGLSDRETHKPAELSGGERQRVAIARALINDPDIILADEPTGNLDSSTALEIMEIFNQLHREGQTIVMVTHEKEIAAYSQRIIELKDGQVINDDKQI